MIGLSYGFRSHVIRCVTENFYCYMQSRNRKNENFAKLFAKMAMLQGSNSLTLSRKNELVYRLQLSIIQKEITSRTKDNKSSVTYKSK